MEKMEKITGHGLVVKPKVIEFTDVFPALEISHKKVYFHNKGKKKLILKIMKPYSWVFQVDDDSTPIFLSPGLSVVKTITYQYALEFGHESILPFVIDNIYYFDVPIRVKKVQSVLSVSPIRLNFGIIDLGCRFVSQYLTLSNSGGSIAKYAIDFGTNKLDLLATPKQGQIAPYGAQLVKIEMAGFSVGELVDEFWVKGEPSLRIEVEVQVLFPYLQAIHPNTTGDFTLINFLPTYFETERYETFIVQNVSSFPSSFVVLAEMNGYLVTLNRVHEQMPVLANFSISPVEGTLGPFEGHVFTIKFHPKSNLSKKKGWRHLRMDELEYLCFLRILRVDVVEWQEEASGDHPVRARFGRALTTDSYLSGNKQESDLLRVCLHGDGVKPELKAVPDCLYFENVEVGKEYRKVINLKNVSTSLPLGYYYKKVVGFTVIPSSQFIDPKKSFEFTVIFKTKSLNYNQEKLVFDVICNKDLTDMKNLKPISEIHVSLSINMKSTKAIPQPKFNLGITPFISHETGVHTEEIKFKDIHKKGPAMLLVPKKGFEKRHWLKGNSYVAYPNDMPKSMRVKEHDKNVRTIFTGQERYTPPVDREYTYTEEENKTIAKRNLELMNFYHEKGKHIRKALLAQENVSFKKKNFADKRFEKLLMMNETSHFSYSIFSKPPEKPATLNEICPLTPTHLYNIRVMPKSLDFGKIPREVDCVRIIRIDNFNDFPVSIRLVLHKAKMKEQSFIVRPKSRDEKEITLNLKSFGKFYSNVSYVVNNNHTFDLTLTADVVHRSLSVVPADLCITPSRGQGDDIFQMKWAIVKVFNPLYVPSQFRWKVPSGVPFTLEPMNGEVPGNNCVMCAVYFNIRKKTGISATIHLMVKDGQEVPVRISSVEDMTHNVSLLISKRILPSISLNIPLMETVLLFNSGFKDVIYSVLTPDPLEGVTLRPIVGIIPARACIGLEMEIKMTCITAFDFRLLVELQGHDVIESKFIGHIVFPKVVFTPEVLVLRSTPCFSRECYNFEIENQSQALVKVQFKLENYPQISVSLSKKHDYPVVDEDGVIIQAGMTKELYLHFAPNDLATYEFLLPVILNKIIGPSILYNEDTQNPETYITINRDNIKLRKYFNLECPTKVTSIHLDCSVAKGYLEFSKRHLSFKIIGGKEFKRKSILIKNITKTDVNIFFEESALAPTPFSLVENENDVRKLEPGASSMLTVEFKPMFPNVFEYELPVYVKEFSDSVAYTFISLNGTLSKSALYCPTSLIHFLPVPIDCCIERPIEVIATHQHKETKLRCFMRRIMGEYQGEDVLQFVYPKGNKIPINREPLSVPILIRFIAKKNLSIRGTIVITDEQDGQCLVQFTASADNAVVSSHIYLFLKREMQPLHDERSISSTDVYDKTARIRLDKISFVDMNPEVVEQIINYPKFPKTSSNSNYAVYMRRVMKTMEQWLFEQGFNGSYRMVIGEHVAFTKAYITAKNARSKSASIDNVKSIVDLMFNFVGRDLFLQYQIPPIVPEDDSGRISYSLAVYKQVLNFIKVQGGNTSHIFPVFLLNYEDYIFYYNEVRMKNLEKNKKTAIHYQDMFDEQCSTQVFLTEEEFKRYNLQSWLDLILQIHRTIIQAGIPYRNELKMCIDAPRSTDSNMFSPRSIPERGVSFISVNNEFHVYEMLLPSLKKSNLEKSDKILVTWLNQVYSIMIFKRDVKDVNWPSKLITNLSEDLQDGVALCAVTLFYCPYLAELYFNDFYFAPTDLTQFHHNGVVLATVWNIIRLGITVLPTDFYNLNPVAMNIIVCHLYLVMRSYVPLSSIQFLSVLSQSVTRKISVTNTNTSPIGYTIKIIGDLNGSFSVDKLRPIITISAKTTVTIPLSYMARIILPVKAILLMSGTCLPNGYSNNMVFRLEGEPHKLLVSNEYIVSTPVYRPTFINAAVASPYKVEAEYEIWYCEEEPQPDNLNIQKWSTSKRHKVPRILYIGCDRLFVPPLNSIHLAVLPLTAASYSLITSIFWIILRNHDIGDFIVKVIIKPRVENPFLILPVTLPEGICTGYPKMRCSYNCPRTFSLYIPCRNARLWTTVKTMFFLTLEKKENSFWDHHLETRIGLDLVRWMLKDHNVSVAQEIKYMFNAKVKYKIKSEHRDLEIEPYVLIEDVHSPGFVQVMAHICCTVKNDRAINIKLESSCGKEIRYYAVHFTKSSMPIATKKTSMICRKCKVISSSLSSAKHSFH